MVPKEVFHNLMFGMEIKFSKRNVNVSVEKLEMLCPGKSLKRLI
jgi:hypothetical protein